MDVAFKEDINTTLDKTAAQNLNIINKWCLSILELFEIGKNIAKEKTLLYQHECQKVFETGTKSVRLDNSV